MHAACPIHLIHCDFITIITCGEEYKLCYIYYHKYEGALSVRYVNSYVIRKVLGSIFNIRLILIFQWEIYTLKCRVVYARYDFLWSLEKRDFILL
jgi:hypothetical protein